MIDYDDWKTTPEPPYFIRAFQQRGLKKGSLAWDEAIKKEFAEAVAIELLSGNEDNWALQFVINKFFGDINDLKKAIEVEVTNEDEAFQEFKFES